MTFRKVLFWIHLCSGITAGAIVFIMSVTGVLLTYERQMIAWADRGYRSTPPNQGAARLPAETLVSSFQEHRGGLPTTITLRADPNAPVEAAFGRDATWYVDVYSGRILGEGARGIRNFFRVVTDWHRWLGTEGEGRATGRAITGACNLAFLLLIVTGAYIWLPRKLTWQHVRPVAWFRGGLGGKARDFNWHNTIGVWSAVPLFFIVLGGLVISYPWATNLLYRLTGSEPPAVQGPPGGLRLADGAKPGPGRRPEGAGGQPNSQRGNFDGLPQRANFDGLDQAWRKAEQQVAGWQSITLRLAGGGPLAFTIDQANRGRPDKRSMLTVNRRTGEVIRHETFESYNLGRKMRTWLRWIHTGEALGVVGQTIAGLVSLGASLLVYTGVALSLRRFRAWLARTRVRSKESEKVAVTQ